MQKLWKSIKKHKKKKAYKAWKSIKSIFNKPLTIHASCSRPRNSESMSSTLRHSTWTRASTWGCVSTRSSSTSKSHSTRAPSLHLKWNRRTLCGITHNFLTLKLWGVWGGDWKRRTLSFRASFTLTQMIRLKASDFEINTNDFLDLSSKHSHISIQIYFVNARFPNSNGVILQGKMLLPSSNLWSGHFFSEKFSDRKKVIFSKFLQELKKSVVMFYSLG